MDGLYEPDESSQTGDLWIPRTQDATNHFSWEASGPEKSFTGATSRSLTALAERPTDLFSPLPDVSTYPQTPQTLRIPSAKQSSTARVRGAALPVAQPTSPEVERHQLSAPAPAAQPLAAAAPAASRSPELDRVLAVEPELSSLIPQTAPLARSSEWARPTPITARKVEPQAPAQVQPLTAGAMSRMAQGWLSAPPPPVRVDIDEPVRGSVFGPDVLTPRRRRGRHTEPKPINPNLVTAAGFGVAAVTAVSATLAAIVTGPTAIQRVWNNDRALGDDSLGSGLKPVDDATVTLVTGSQSDSGAQAADEGSGGLGDWIDSWTKDESDNTDSAQKAAQTPWWRASEKNPAPSATTAGAGGAGTTPAPQGSTGGAGTSTGTNQGTGQGANPVANPATSPGANPGSNPGTVGGTTPSPEAPAPSGSAPSGGTAETPGATAPSTGAPQPAAPTTPAPGADASSPSASEPSAPAPVVTEPAPTTPPAPAPAPTTPPAVEPVAPPVSQPTTPSPEPTTPSADAAASAPAAPSTTTPPIEVTPAP